MFIFIFYFSVFNIHDICNMFYHRAFNCLSLYLFVYKQHRKYLTIAKLNTCAKYFEFNTCNLITICISIMFNLVSNKVISFFNGGFFRTRETKIYVGSLDEIFDFLICHRDKLLYTKAKIKKKKI